MCIIVIFAVPPGDVFNFLINLVCTFPILFHAQHLYYSYVELVPCYGGQLCDLIWINLSRLP